MPRKWPKRVVPYGGAQHRVAKTEARGVKVRLRPDHPAIVDGHSIFPDSVIHASLAPRLLIDGHNSRKTGKMVTKGRWAGSPIFTLTLEERRTCPRECAQWATCYGNNMHWARRLIGDEVLERRLWDELKAKSEAHPSGFVVRLHILGDFYAVHYVEFWERALAEFEALRIFGYTAWPPDTEIGLAVLRMTSRTDLRCWIRFSGFDARGMGAVVIDDPAQSTGIICPAQTDRTDCCGTCGLCWTAQRTIEFLRH